MAEADPFAASASDQARPRRFTVPTVVLASGSTTRLSLLRGAGVEVLARPAALDEAALKHQGRMRGLGAGSMALHLAQAKALAGLSAVDAPSSGRPAPTTLVIGADQMLCCEGEWFDKPASLDHARSQLLRLRGRPHRLHTACCVAWHEAVRWQHLSSPCLVMRDFTECFLDDYLRREGETLLGCVGAYRFEGLGAQLFDRVEGTQADILGLPLLPLLQLLRGQGALPD